MTARQITSMVIAAALLSALLNSCSSAPTRLYTLYAVPPPASASTRYSGPAIRIDVVHVPPGLDRIEVVSNLSPGELKVNDLDHWSAPLSQIAKQALSADLVARLPPGRVIFPHLAKPEGTLGVSVDILDFRADSSGTTLEAGWIITSANPETAARRGTAQFRGRGSGAGASATADALSALLAELADRIAADVAHDGD